MNFLSRVVWSEGMYIGPHHFQAQSRYFEDSIQFATSAIWPNNHGFLGLELDSESLHNGTLSVLHARGIFSDGLLFKMPEADSLPLARELAGSFPSDRDSVTVFLSIDPYLPDGRNCSDDSGARFLAKAQMVPDEMNGRDQKPVRTARKNIVLAFEPELSPQAVSLPVTRLLRSGSGKFTFDPNFIPPTLQIGASPRLMVMLQQMVDLLEEKSDSLTGGASGSGKTGYSTREIANFWFRHALNAGLAPLRHLLYTKRGHPEELYTELARLAGALCTFTLEIHPRSIPQYRHIQADECFDALDKLIRSLLEAVLPTNCLSIALTPAGDYLHNGAVNDQRTLGRAIWVFAIRAKLSAAELIQKTPQLIKICSEQFVPELVKRALPGLTLTHMPAPPAAIPASAETQYFLVSRQGPCWNHLVETRKVGVYVPGEFSELEMQLFVVLEQ